MGHTPGEWKFREWLCEPEDIELLAKIGKQPTPATDNDGSRTVMGPNGPVAKVPMQREVKRSERYSAEDEERDANARLIASAPDLLDALEEAVTLAAAWAGTYQAQHELKDLHPTHAALLSQCHFALRKAKEGE